MRMGFWIFGLLVVALLVYIRVAPTDPAIWHTAVTATQDKDMTGGAIRVLPAPQDALETLDRIALETPRTTRIAGSPHDGRVTYQTRSFWIGFPDYTTAEVVDGQLRIFARLRFGRSDLSVNRTRITAWIAALTN